MTDLAICIVSYHSRALVEKCINSILNSVSGLACCIIVVDNNSGDGTIEMVKQKYPATTVIANKENMGFAYANNQAIRSTEARYYLLLNSDTVVLPGALDKLAGFMDSHPEAGAAGARLLNKDGTLQASCKTFFDLRTAYFVDTFLGKLFPGVEKTHRMAGFKYDRTIEVDQPMGAALIVRKKAIEKLGLLDERFFFFFEEVDWCLRIKRAGWKIFFVHDAVIMHYRDNPIKEDEGVKRVFLWHKGKYLFLEKYYPLAAVIILRAFVVLSSVLFIIFKPAIAEKKSYWALLKASL